MDIERVFQAVRLRGPLQPNDIKKILGGDTVIIGAMLSDLAAQSRVRITALKMGSSPFYYTDEQSSQLQEISKYLGEKDRRAYDFLQKECLLPDSRLDPLTRVALRSLKDFAKPLEVTVNGQPALFWKWYLTGHDEAMRLLQERFATAPPIPEGPPPREVATALTSGAARPGRGVSDQALLPTPVAGPSGPARPAPPKGARAPKTTLKATDAASPFAERLKKFFERHEIQVLEQAVHRRGSDHTCILRVPSSVGAVTFACKALGKARITEADVTAAYAFGAHRHLPVLLIAAGQLTKKGQEQLVHYKSVTHKRL